jgi:hypothetical protein
MFSMSMAIEGLRSSGSQATVRRERQVQKEVLVDDAVGGRKEGKDVREKVCLVER